MVNADSFALLVSGTVSSLLAAILIRKKEKRARIFTLFCIALSLHGLSGFFVGLTDRYAVALFFDKLSILGAIVAVPLLIHFSHEYCRVQRKYVLLFVYSLSSLFVLGLLSDMFIEDVVSVPGSFRAVPGPLYKYFVAYAILSYLYILLSFVMYIKKTKVLERERTRYLVFFMSVMAFCAILDFLSKMGVFVITQLLIVEYGIIIFAAGVTYTIIKYNLLDIRLVFKKSMIYSSISIIVIGMFEILKFIVERLLHVFFHLYSDISSIVSVLILTFFFEPIKKKTEEIFDHIFTNYLESK